MARPIKNDEPKRRNRATGLGELLGRTLDPVFQKRGFASRDIVAHWSEIAPEPYNRLTLPDRLKWPRGASGAEGAVLFLRCAPGQGLAIAHEGERIATAVNRYFGYVLVGHVRMSANPLTPADAEKAAPRNAPPLETVNRVAEQVERVEDAGVREALRRLGEGLLSRKQT